MFQKHTQHLGVITLGYTLGIAFAYYNTKAPFLGVAQASILCVLLLLLVFFSIKSQRGFWIFCFITAGWLGALRMASEKPSLKAIGIIEQNTPQKFLFKITKTLKATTKQYRFEATIEKTSLNHQKLSYKKAGGTPIKTLLVLPKNKEIKPFNVGDNGIALGYLSRPNAPSLPGQFNYANYLKTQGIYNQLYVVNAVITPQRQLSFKSKLNTVKYKVLAFKAELLKKIKQSGLSKGAFQVYSALVFGDKNEFNPTLLETYQNAGAVHILAISGLHIGILLGLLYGLFLPLHGWPNGQYISSILIVLCLWAYAFFTGLSPSVIRAVSMFSILTLSLILKRPLFSLHLLLVAFLFNIIWNPLAIFSLGFCMSYAAVTSILIGMPLFSKWWTPKNIILIRLWQLISVSILAQVGVLAISLYAFHKFPLLFLITNLLVIPFLGVVLSFGIVLAFWFGISNPPQKIVQIFDALLQQLNHVIGWVGAQEQWVITDIYFPVAYLIAAFVLVCALFVGLHSNTNKKAYYFFLIGALVAQGIFAAQNLANTYTQQHFIIKNKGQIILLALYETEATYWSVLPLDTKSLKTIQTQYPVKKFTHQPLNSYYTLKKWTIAISPKRKVIQGPISHLVIDEHTRLLPKAFTPQQLLNTTVLWSGYTNTKEKNAWEAWVKKNERPNWRLDAQGYFTLE